MNNESTELGAAIERLLAAEADYKAFVRTTKSHQLACEGARGAANTERSNEPD
jgi:hypothetical protein